MNMHFKYFKTIFERDFYLLYLIIISKKKKREYEKIEIERKLNLII
jgi:hypothetical protein